MKHYEVNFRNIQERHKFRDIVYKKMLDNELTVKDVAGVLGYSPKSLYQFFNSDEVKNRFLAAALADYFKIERKEYRCGSDEEY